MALLAGVLDYWFGPENEDLKVINSRSKLWFGKDARIDQEIKQKFGALVERAVAEKLKAENFAAHLSHLAQIILIDQFSRNIYRDDSKAFAADPVALQMTLDGLEPGEDQLLRPVERLFYYLPLEHSENLIHQNRSVALFRQLQEDVPVDWQPAFAGFTDYAVRHQVIIERFGRFPHRNAILGRVSTAAELEFLRQPNSSF